MYSILLSGFGTMTVVSKNSLTYPELVMLGYYTLFTGSKRECQAQLTEWDLQCGW